MTLAEMAIAAGITSTVLGTVAGFVVPLNRALDDQRVNAEVQQRTRAAFHRLQRDLRDAGVWSTRPPSGPALVRPAVQPFDFGRIGRARPPAQPDAITIIVPSPQATHVVTTSPLGSVAAAVNVRAAPGCRPSSARRCRLEADSTVMIVDGSARSDFLRITDVVAETLLESELFGHEKGAFTGAVARKPGKFEVAHRGTLFLDEIGDLPLPLQAKILRAIEERRFERVGGNNPLQVDVRLVAATNKDLQAAVANRQFREDLFFRLSVFPITIPPLRERRDDISILANYFTDRFCKELKKPALGLSPQAEEGLNGYSWPGNVRELQNCIERAVILCDTAEIQPRHLSLASDQVDAGASAIDAWESLNLSGTLAEASIRIHGQFEKRKIAQELRESNGDRKLAAQRLQIPQASLLQKLKQHHLD